MEVLEIKLKAKQIEVLYKPFVGTGEYPDESKAFFNGANKEKHKVFEVIKMHMRRQMRKLRARHNVWWHQIQMQHNLHADYT